jgi:hypothetical protein
MPGGTGRLKGRCGPTIFWRKSQKNRDPQSPLRGLRSLDPTRPARPADIVLEAQEPTMFTPTFTLDHHIEELRTELRGALSIREARRIKKELDAALLMRADLVRLAEAARWP